jgi:hypothetical protein
MMNVMPISSEAAIIIINVTIPFVSLLLNIMVMHFLSAVVPLHSKPGWANHYASLIPYVKRIEYIPYEVKRM